MKTFRKYLSELDSVQPTNPQQAQQAVTNQQQQATVQAQAQQKMQSQVKSMANNIIALAKNLNMTPAQIYSAIGQLMPKQ